MKKKAATNKLIVLKVVICCGFFLYVFCPFLHMLLHIKAGDFQYVFSSASFSTALKNSVKIATITTIISVSLGLLLAYCMQRTKIRGKGVISVLLILPMLIPSISHSTALIVLFGTNGIITNTFKVGKTIYGMNGIILGSVLYSYPIAFLMFDDILKYQDGASYEAAEILGIKKFYRLFAITVPFLVKPLIAALFSVFTLVITDYGIPLMIGGKTTTLAVMMYQEVLGQLDFGRGSIIGILLLVPAVFSFIVTALLKNIEKQGYETKSFQIRRNLLRDGLAYAFVGIIICGVVALIGAFCVVAFTVKYPSNMTITWSNVRKMFTLRGGIYLRNSVIIALSVAFIGSFVAFVTAYLTVRVPSKISRLLHLLSITTLAIPGLVLGLSYAIAFSKNLMYGTIGILILVNIIHFFASPYQMMYNALNKLNCNLESVGKTLGISRMRMIIAVIVPQCKCTLLEMFYYFFVNSMMTISAVSFLANVSTKPISLMIGQFEAQMLYECAAVVSIFILISNLLMKIMVMCLTNIATKRNINK